MNGEAWERREKDKILQEINDELERQDWGGDYEKVTIRVTLKGRLNLMPLEIDQRVKRRSI